MAFMSKLSTGFFDSKLSSLSQKLLISCLIAASLVRVYALPNIIIILTDDQGYNDVGVFGSPLIKTPRLDKLANTGVRFTDFYVAQNVCSASRASLLTGSHHLRVGIAGVLSPNSQIGLNPNEVTLADFLKRKGYATACVGKWHLGDAPKFLPTRQGFDSYLGLPYSNDMYYNKTFAVLDSQVKLNVGWTLAKIASTKVDSFPKALLPLMRNEKVIEYPVDQTTLTKRYTDEALSFIADQAKASRPFFLYLAHTMPHTPLNPSPAFLGKSARGTYGDVVEEIDYHVGRIADTLKSLGIDKNTLVIYTSDNGPWLAKGTLAGSAFPLRDGKFTDWEGGQRVPCIMNWPGHIPPNLVQKEMATTLDIYPTIAKLVGLPLPTNEKVNGNNIVMDGVDIMPLMTGVPGAKRDIPFFYDLQAVRFGDWKLVHDSLFNLSSDIGETTDLSLSQPAKKKELQDLLNAFNNSLVKRGAGTLQTADPLGGCTNVDAPNYNPLAGRDDGSCKAVTTLLGEKPFSKSYQIIQGRIGPQEIRLDKAGWIEIFSLTGKREWNDQGRFATVHPLSGVVFQKGFHWLRIHTAAETSLQGFLMP